MLNPTGKERKDAEAFAGFSHIDFRRTRSVVIAVSGGSDSLALLLQAKAYLEQHAAGTKPVAVTVDHGLRSESAAEARHVAAICVTLGIPHTTLTWQGEKPQTGRAEAARNARYDLLGGFAIKTGAGLVLTGHTRDDQRETVLMRKDRAEGGGLAGIPEATFWRHGAAGVWFARPLLRARRDALRVRLRQSHVAWVDDPSNRHLAYERVRARRTLAALDDTDPLIASLDRERQRQAGARFSLSSRTAAMMRRHVRQVSPGLFFLPDAFLLADDHEAVVHGLRVMLAHVGGRTHLADDARARRLAGRFADRQHFSATLSRTRIVRRDGGVYLLREARHVDGSGEIFDSRFAAGSAAAPYPAADDTHPSGLARQALSRHPLGTGGETRLLPLLNPWARLVPVFDLEAARALASIAGAAYPPVAPVQTMVPLAN